MFDFIVFTEHPNAYAPIRFMKEAKNMDLRFKIYEYGKIKNIKTLPSAKFVILREPDSESDLYKLRDNILKFYDSHNSKILNHKSYFKWSLFDKFLQHEEFKKADIPSLPLLTLEEARYPYIAKAKLGSHGSQVFKINNKLDLENLLKKYKLEDLLIQEFQNSGFDLRVIVLNGRVLGIMKRTPRIGNFLSNYSQGGVVNKYNEDNNSIKTIQQIALKTAKHFMLDYCGVDLMKDNNDRWIVLEVNRACQFRGFEKATGINVAKKIYEENINISNRQS